MIIESNGKISTALGAAIGIVFLGGLLANWLAAPSPLRLVLFCAMAVLLLCALLIGPGTFASKLARIFEALYAPCHAISMPADYRPVSDHVSFWALVLLLVAAGTAMLDWPIRYIGVPFAALLLCRLALAERNIRRTKNRARKTSQGLIPFFGFRHAYRPCFVTARRIRSIPSGVLGPVLNPP